MSPIDDPIADGLARGWRVIDGSSLAAARRFDADVVIIGSGAGGGVSAEILTRAGLSVLIVEEGALKSSRHFKMREADAYPQLYQESAARKTADKAINILQGRTVGGSTTVNWTSSFRTPPATLAVWRQRFGLADYSPEALAPWFAQMEERLGIAPWLTPPNENNDLLARGARVLGIPTASIKRNVRGCWNLGYCGMGCPTNAKQSMLVTTIPAALDGGASLLTRVRAERLVFKGGAVDHVLCSALHADGLAPSGVTVTIRARHYVLAGGAINGPALLLRSEAPDPHQLLGRRTFLHPTVISAALFEQRVDAYAGAPQTIYSDHFLQADPVTGPIGYKLEAPPLHPVLMATTFAGFGADHAAAARQFPHQQALLALLRDGFHDDSPGGTVRLQKDGAALLDYRLTGYMWDGVRRAYLTMAEIQFAAGARQVKPIHENAALYTSWAAAKSAIGTLDYQPHLARVVSAHVMGGCAMAGDARLGLVTPDGRYRQVANLSVHDGSLFPTAVGANPQLSIYAVAARLASALARDLAA
ncbi:GMC family oxidoreductase N-terminal domain-containing protein [Massilia sp. DWR3-1-1]|uniref:GMC family oxidoreductase N-terminal domain-containing protein n=1 Tax=Massilia sp. DWR3-1-1 TaxID=2804559 RepID=UPI003CF63BC5